MLRLTKSSQRSSKIVLIIGNKMTNNFATNLTVLKTTMKKKEWPILGSHICSIKIQNLTVPIINIYINNLFQSFLFRRSWSRTSCSSAKAWVTNSTIPSPKTRTRLIFSSWSDPALRWILDHIIRGSWLNIVFTMSRNIAFA